MESLHQNIERNRPALVECLAELVRIPTVNPPGANYEPLVRLLERKCRELGMETEIHTVPAEEACQYVPNADAHPRYNLVARWNVGATETVHLNSHYDVVPVSGGWTKDPFGAESDGERLYGRGSDDMKDSIAATLFALRAFRETGLSPAFNIECSFTADEEIGGDLGAGYLARHKLIQADYVVNCEGGTGTNVGCGHNGVLWLEVAVLGKAAHASRPESGLNAFEKMAELAAALQHLKTRFVAPERVYKTPSGAERRPTINLGGVFFGSDGDKVNTVPARAVFTIDRRILPNETLESAERELRGAIETTCSLIPNLNVEVKRTLGIEPCVVDTTHPFVQSFASAVNAVRGETSQFSITAGFTDLHFLVDDGKRPGVGYGPKGDGAHGADETSDLADLVTTTKIYAEFLAKGIQ